MIIAIHWLPLVEKEILTADSVSLLVSETMTVFEIIGDERVVHFRFRLCDLIKPGTHHAIFVVCWTQRRRKDDCCMVCAYQRQLSPVDFTNATVVGPIRKTNRSNNCCMVCAGQRHLSHQPTGHRPIKVKHFRDA